MPKPLPVIEPVSGADACCAPLMAAPLSVDLTEDLGLSQPTVTHPLHRLATAGLAVPDRKVGNFTCYRVVTDAVHDLASVLGPVTPV